MWGLSGHQGEELASVEEQLTSTTIKRGLLEVTRVIAIYHHVIVSLLSRVQIQQNYVHGDKMRGIHGFTRMTSVCWRNSKAYLSVCNRCKTKGGRKLCLCFRHLHMIFSF